MIFKSINTGIDCDIMSDSMRLNGDVYRLVEGHPVSIPIHLITAMKTALCLDQDPALNVLKSREIEMRYTGTTHVKVDFHWT